MTSAGYLCGVFVNFIPMAAVIAFSIIIAAFRVELFSAAIVERLSESNITSGGATDRDLPLEFCFYFNEDDDIYGDRICNNALAGSIISILVAMVLLLVDVQVPCVSKSASYAKLVQLITLLWAVVLAVYWLISAAQLAHLYDTFCEERNHACNGTMQKFILLPVLGFFCMIAWIVQGIFAIIRMILVKSPTYA